MKIFTKNCETKYFIWVLYHFTAKSHLKTFSLVHSLKVFKQPKKNNEPISDFNVHRLIVFVSKLVVHGVFVLYCKGKI